MTLHFTLEVTQYVRCYIKSWQYIRISSFKVGCKGLSYEVNVEPRTRREDLVVCIDGVRILINQRRNPCGNALKVAVRGVSLGIRLVIVSPKATICGCGKSLSFSRT
ncbi:hypothetical protein [Candidatus Tremblaya phenacola]|uniref:Iron-sulfur cluster insertion protein IscA n=1 Tax=Candidatus Tremblayella phenacoccinincola TaxID=1010676 RepID=A0A2G0V703_9PROT|nr:hypothetical protein [Candidatus Tremblaya phenacola]PHN16243.1 Iron-sulfur cluster insertion protein IscA [Candidatus Tremblaya phenacola]